MLVLSRKMDEEIVIGDEIRITVLRVKGDRVKLGIQAGADVKIMRGELLDACPATPTTESESVIADPTAGLIEEGVAEDSTTHPAGTSDGEPPRPNSRPAWLTICCCS